jgi:hypothetical protein
LERIVLAKLAAARECGLLLLEAKDALGYANFENLKKEILDEEIVRAYVNFARKNPSPVTNIRDGLRTVEAVCRATGLLEMHPSHGEQILRCPHFFSDAGSLLHRFIAVYQKFITTQPLRRWTVDDAEQLAEVLKPIIKIHNQIADFIAEHRK